MRLTQFTDNALRCLMYLSLREESSAVPIPEIARTMRISEDHLGKIVQRLVRLGYVQTARGRTGGVRLAKPPAEINIGRLIRDTEESFSLVGCFLEDGHNCPLAGACRLAGLLDEGLTAFFRVLDERTLEDVVAQSGRPGVLQTQGG